MSLLNETVKRIEKFGVQSVGDVRKCSEELASFSNDFRQEFLEMKQYLFQNMYRHDRVIRIEDKSKKVIQELFRLYETDPTILPTNTRGKKLRTRKIRSGGSSPITSPA